MARFAGITAEKRKPTKGHRAAMFSGLFGTVYGIGRDGEVRYFDHDWEAAAEFAGVQPEGDPRLWKTSRRVSVGSGPTAQTVDAHRSVLYVLR